MTRADTWKKRPCVVRYWSYKDDLRAKIKDAGIEVKDELYLEFEIPMPKSWSKKKKKENIGNVHQQRPDIDNLVKGVMDCLFKEDSHVHTIYAKKIWAEEGGMSFISKNKLLVY
tara:strand:- start:172 stop:513 length:342 start_codon:yes stop_codon:yes gene_type:complete